MPKVGPNEAAVPASCRVVNVEPCHSHSGHNGGMDFTGETATPASIVVPGISLDDYPDEHGIKQVDLVRLDTESGEFAAIAASSHQGPA